MSYELWITNKLIGVIEADKSKKLIDRSGIVHFYLNNFCIAMIDVDFITVKERKDDN